MTASFSFICGWLIRWHNGNGLFARMSGRACPFVKKMAAGAAQLFQRACV
jgi:hypothetical protein